MSRFSEKLIAHAKSHFGCTDSAAIQHWVEYWSSTFERNRSLMTFFRSKLDLCFTGKKVLDIGCGTAGLSKFVLREGGKYVGTDFYGKTLEFAEAFIDDLPERCRALLARASGTQLPFQARSFDYVIAFDVIEHLVGGNSWQVQFLKEIERVLAPQGILLLTTPNWLCPLEGHTFLIGPQFLPARWADRYIRRFRPQFFRDYKTYREVHLLSPWQIRSMLSEAGLAPLNQLPWCTDLGFYRPLPRMLLGVCRVLSLDWAVFYKFQIAAVKKDSLCTLLPLKHQLSRQRFFEEQRPYQLLQKALKLLK
jgi:SAM-dependent methyltransferase